MVLFCPVPTRKDEANQSRDMFDLFALILNRAYSLRVAWVILDLINISLMIQKHTLSEHIPSPRPQASPKHSQEPVLVPSGSIVVPFWDYLVGF